MQSPGNNSVIDHNILKRAFIINVKQNIHVFNILLVRGYIMTSLHHRHVPEHTINIMLRNKIG